MWKMRAAAAAGLVAAAAVAWIGLRPDPRSGDPPDVTASPSASHGQEDSRGNFEVHRIQVSSRAQLVEEVTALGFDEVMVLQVGRPVRLEHYTTDHLHVRMTYETKKGEVRLFQSNDQGITSGPPVMIRGHEAVRNGDGASWVERDYILDLNPLDRLYVRALRWVVPSGHPSG